MNKLQVCALALAAGISWGSGMLFLGWAASFGWGAELVKSISSLYLGYAPTFLGGIIGGIWGFADGAIGGAILAFFYNLFARG